jgi:hypothetical protein
MFFGHAFLKIAARFSGVASELSGSLRNLFDFDEVVRVCAFGGCGCDEGPEAPIHAGSDLASWSGDVRRLTTPSSGTDLRLPMAVWWWAESDDPF